MVPAKRIKQTVPVMEVGVVLVVVSQPARMVQVQMPVHCEFSGIPQTAGQGLRAQQVACFWIILQDAFPQAE